MSDISNHNTGLKPESSDICNHSTGLKPKSKVNKESKVNKDSLKSMRYQKKHPLTADKKRAQNKKYRKPISALSEEGKEHRREYERLKKRRLRAKASKLGLNNSGGGDSDGVVKNSPIDNVDKKM